MSRPRKRPKTFCLECPSLWCEFEDEVEEAEVEEDDEDEEELEDEVSSCCPPQSAHAIVDLDLGFLRECAES